MTKLGLPEDQPIQNGIISKTIENAQSKIEGFNFDIRKHILDYDDVMNKQREVVYKKRRAILEANNLKPEISEDIDLTFTVETIEVMESELKRGGPQYTILESHILCE